VHYVFNILEIIKKQLKKGMVFKPSFNCFKNEKINFSHAFLDLTLSDHVYIISSYSILIERFRLKQKKKWSHSLKNMPYINNNNNNFVLC